MLNFIYGFASAIVFVLGIQYFAVRQLFKNPHKFIRIIMSKSLKNATVSMPFGDMIQVPPGNRSFISPEYMGGPRIEPDRDGG